MMNYFMVHTRKLTGQMVGAKVWEQLMTKREAAVIEMIVNDNK